MPLTEVFLDTFATDRSAEYTMGSWTGTDGFVIVGDRLSLRGSDYPTGGEIDASPNAVEVDMATGIVVVVKLLPATAGADFYFLVAFMQDAEWSNPSDPPRIEARIPAASGNLNLNVQAAGTETVTEVFTDDPGERWLVARMNESELTGELWHTDPALGGVPALEHSLSGWVPGAFPATGPMVFEGGVPSAVDTSVDYWRIFSGTGAIPPLELPPPPPPPPLPGGIRVLNDTSQELLEMIPVEVQRATTLRAVYDVAGYELDILNAWLDKIAANTTPATADDFLHFFEEMLGIAIYDPSLTLQARRDTVTAFYARATSDGSGLSWEDNATELLGTQWTYKKHDPADPTSPPAATIHVYLPYSQGAAGARRAEVLLRTITPANTVLLVTYSQGFILDESQLDFDAL